MNKFNHISLILLIVLSAFVAQCQPKIDYNTLFRSSITSPQSDYYYGKMYRNAESGNAMRFLEMGYFVNAINEYYYRTNDKQYFVHNAELIEKLKSSSEKLDVGNKWIVNFSRKSDTNYEMLNKEFILYEGYLFRYLAQYIYITDQIGQLNFENLKFVKENFDKWANRNEAKYGDMGEMYGLRLHMGSHWATVALYLYMISKESKYKDFYDSFNSELKRALKVNTVKGNACYIWDSTYPIRFNALLKQKNRKYSVVKQDVSHGNHIVQFILDSYRCKQGGWTREDIDRLCNTLKFIIWVNPKVPTDNVDGSVNNAKLLHKTGWKQTDGWMKLIQYDGSLKTIYDNYYRHNKSQINKFNPFPQFYVNMF